MKISQEQWRIQRGDGGMLLLLFYHIIVLLYYVKLNNK